MIPLTTRRRTVTVHDPSTRYDPLVPDPRPTAAHG